MASHTEKEDVKFPSDIDEDDVEQEACIVCVAENNIVVYNENFDKKIPIKQFRVSDTSDKLVFDGKTQYVGFVLYNVLDNNGKLGDTFTLNGTQCCPGLVHIKQFKEIFGVKQAYSYHERTYKQLFGINIDPNRVIGAGFSYSYERTGDETSELIWKFNSKTFNAPKKAEQWKENDPSRGCKVTEVKEDWHDLSKSMSELEIKWLRKVIRNYKNGIKILSVPDELKKFKEYGKARWSWRRKGKWIQYEEINQKEIENNYSRGLKVMTLSKGLFATTEKLSQYTYNIYFDGSVRGHAFSEHSIDYPNWKTDKDMKNKYFMQKNASNGLVRVIRRRQMS